MEDEQKKIEHYVKEFGLLKVIPQEILPYMSLSSYQPGESVCSQGEAADTLYFLVRGKIKIYTTSSEGKTLVLSFKSPLDLVGDIEYVQRCETLNTVEAVTPVQMLAIPYRWLDRFGDQNAAFLKFMLEIITKKFFMKSSSLSFNLMYPAEVRLASYLLSVVDDGSEEAVNSQVKLEVLKDAAGMIGVSYRHMNRILSQWAEAGLVKREPDGITLRNWAELKEMSKYGSYES